MHVGVLPTVVSPGAIWAEFEPGFHVELETAIWVDVLPDKRRDGAQVRRRQPPSPVRPRLSKNTVLDIVKRNRHLKNS